LQQDEQKLIEDGYRDKTLSYLFATSTLAVGVNLPAKRVIFSSPHIGGSLIDTTRYRQMSGRAGRAGKDSGLSFECLYNNCSLNIASSSTKTTPSPHGIMVFLITDAIRIVTDCRGCCVKPYVSTTPELLRHFALSQPLNLNSFIDFKSNVCVLVFHSSRGVHRGGEQAF